MFFRDLKCQQLPAALNRAVHVSLMIAVIGGSVVLASCQSQDFADRDAVRVDFEDRAGDDRLLQINDDVFVANAWMELLGDLIEQNGVSPPAAARAYGYASVTLYETARFGNPRLKSLQGQLNGLRNLPQPEPGQTYIWPLVTDVAMHWTLSDLFNDLMASGGFAPMAILRHGIQDHYLAIAPDEATFQRSIDLGERLGRAVSIWAIGDGFRRYKDCAYEEKEGDGYWRRTAPDFDDALEPCFGELRPMVIGTREECQPPPPPEFSTEPDSTLHREMMEVYNTVNKLTPEEMAIAEFWADDPGVSPTSAGHFMEIAQELIKQRGLSFDQAAEVYARLGISMSDSFVSTWRAKYTWNTIRPITYLHRYKDEKWETSIITPPFPDYPSGHSTASASATTALESYFGPISYVDNTYSKLNLPARRYPRFSAAADEAAYSRILGGVHNRASIVSGLAMGRCVGDRISQALRFK